jgi:prophage antirepressor-like protein
MFLTHFDFKTAKLDFYKAPNGEPVVSAASLIRALKGNANNAAAIARANVRSKWIVEIPTLKGGKPIVCLFEPGAYQLAGNPMFQTELAEEFQDWLFEDVLPKLRASGGYIMPNATSEQLEALQAEISTIQQERDKAIWQRDRAEFSMGLSTAELQDLKVELSFIYSEALPQFVEIVNRLSIIGLEFENSLRDDLADFRCDMAHKRIKSEKYFDNPNLMPSSKTSLATLRRELNKLEEKKLLPKVIKLLELLAKKSDTALTVV